MPSLQRPRSPPLPFLPSLLSSPAGPPKPILPSLLLLLLPPLLLSPSQLLLPQ